MLRTALAGRPNPSHPCEPTRYGKLAGLSQTGFHQIAYTDWGPMHAEVPVICVHGLSRQGRDFDYLAAHLGRMGRRVVCPDLVGHGRSGTLRHPQEYSLQQYCTDISGLIAHVGAAQVDWIGTSLGGMIGIALAGLPGTPIRRIVINDIAPSLPWAGVSRIGRFLNDRPSSFRSLIDVEAYFREVLAPFGSLSEAHWRHLSYHSVEWDEARQRYKVRCDSGIFRGLRNPWRHSADLWRLWKTMDMPILVVRGAESDILPPDLALKMIRRNPNATVYKFAGCGHAPPLMTDEQIELVAAFINAE